VIAQASVFYRGCAGPSLKDVVGIIPSGGTQVVSCGMFECEMVNNEEYLTELDGYRLASGRVTEKVALLEFATFAT